MLLSAYLNGLCSFNIPFDVAVGALETNLSRYGKVRRVACNGFESTLRCLLPLASFPSRYLVLPLNKWVVILCNGRPAVASSQLLSLSMSTECLGTCGTWSHDGCVWEVVNQGREVRAITCYVNGNRWEFHQEGEPLSFEDLTQYNVRRIRDRFTTEMLQAYLSSIVGISFPLNWRDLMSGDSMCLERSIAKVKVPIEEYEVEVDL